MRRAVAIVVLCVSGAAGWGQTQVSGDQTGTWTLAGSPYELVGDVRVPAGGSLAIEPGVVVIGMGHYSITVGSAATLTAEGSDALPITFTSADQGEGWRGMRLVGASDATSIAHCVFEHARADGLGYPEVRGGALAIIGCSPTVAHSEFRFNLSRNGNLNGVGGGILTETSNAVIHSNYVHDNEADSGAGICITEFGTPRVWGNVVVGNHANYAGGGMYFGARSSPEVYGNLIADNFSAGWGGGGINSWTSHIFNGTYATIHNNVIVRNRTSTAGGGLYCRYDGAVIANNVIAFNEAAGNGGGIHALNQGSSEPRVENCVVWGNTASSGAQIGLEGSTGSVIVVQYSDVEGGWSGAGNIDADPMFVDAEGDDFALAAGSPCIDAGSNFGVPPGVTTDYAGNDRFVDDPATEDSGQGTAPIVDMGALEHQACRADFNGDGIVNTQDVLAFLNAWTAGEDSADFNGDGTINTQDVLAFLNAWAGGC